MRTAQNLIEQMRSYIGAVQGDEKHHHIVDTYNAHSPLARGYKVLYTDPWCATTVSAAAIETGMTDIIPTECSCTRQINLFRKLGRYVEDDDYVPSPGDLIYYNWKAKTAPEDEANHVGMVETSANGKIVVIEGNYGNSHDCRRRTVPVGWKYIHGFAIPAFDKPTANDTQPLHRYTVKPGDYLTKIAVNLQKMGYKVTWKDLAMMNGIKFPYTIYPGQILKFER